MTFWSTNRAATMKKYQAVVFCAGVRGASAGLTNRSRRSSDSCQPSVFA